MEKSYYSLVGEATHMPANPPTKGYMTLKKYCKNKDWKAVKAKKKKKISLAENTALPPSLWFRCYL